MKKVKLSDLDYTLDRNHTVSIPVNQTTMLVISPLEVFALSKAIMTGMLTDRKVPAKVMTAVDEVMSSRRTKRPAKSSKKVAHKKHKRPKTKNIV